MECTQVAPLLSALERIGESDAARMRLLFCGRLAHALGRWMPGLALSPADPPDDAADDGTDGDATHFGVTLRGAQAELTLRLPRSIDAVSASVMAAGAWSPAVQLVCLQTRADAALGGLLAWLAGLDLRPTQLISRPHPLAPGADSTAFTCRLGLHRVDGVLRCDADDWLQRAVGAAARLAPPQLSRVAGLPLPVAVVLGVRRLTLRVLRSLGVGDALLLDRQAGPAGSIDNAWLVAGRGRGSLAWPCSVQGREITATGDHWMNTATLGARTAGEHDAPTGPAGRPARPDPMADLEVDLHLQLQVLSTPLSELAAMRPGYVLELPMPAAQACVDLIVGDQVYGRAQLVSIGDRLGARILELFDDA